MFDENTAVYYFTTPAPSVQAEPTDTSKKLRREAHFVALAAIGLVAGLVGGWMDAPAIIGGLGYGVAYVFGGWFGLRAGWKALRRLQVDIDLLMVLAALGALVIGAPFEGALLLFLFSLSNVLQHMAMGRSRAAVRALMKLRPEIARVQRKEGWVMVPVEEVAVNEIFEVRPGERLPLDGVVIEGQSEVNQAELTGESMPVLKGPEDTVFGGTMNGPGSLTVRVTKQAGATALARMVQLVEEAQSEKARTQQLLDRFEQPYAMGVIGLTLVAIVFPIVVWGDAFDPAFYRAMTLMVAASPCALIISTPASVLSAVAAAARHGVLFKGGAYVEATGTLRAIAFDKTGTLTKGETRLTDVVPLESASADEVLALAATVQARSEHHIAKATIQAAEARGLTAPASEDFQAVIGKGVTARVGHVRVHVGNRRYFEEKTGAAWETADTAMERLLRTGQTAVIVAREAAGTLEPLGAMGFADQLRPAAPDVIRQLRALGIEHVVLITGDNQAVAERIAREAGVDEVYAEVLPEQKVAVIRKLRETYGSVAMVGDGVNDAPALAVANVGVAMGAVGTDVALETADLVLMADDLGKLPFAIALSRRTRRTLAVNLGFAFGMIALMIGFILAIGLPLPLAVVGHEGSTVLVSLNGLRLLSARP